jgi:hypothetical protein
LRVHAVVTVGQNCSSPPGAVRRAGIMAYREKNCISSPGVSCTSCRKMATFTKTSAHTAAGRQRAGTVSRSGNIGILHQMFGRMTL